MGRLPSTEGRRGRPRFRIQQDTAGSDTGLWRSWRMFHLMCRRSLRRTDRLGTRLSRMYRFLAYFSRTQTDTGLQGRFPNMAYNILVSCPDMRPGSI